MEQRDETSTGINNSMTNIPKSTKNITFEKENRILETFSPDSI